MSNINLSERIRWSNRINFQVLTTTKHVCCFVRVDILVFSAVKPRRVSYLISTDACVQLDGIERWCGVVCAYAEPRWIIFRTEPFSCFVILSDVFSGHSWEIFYYKLLFLCSWHSFFVDN